MAKRFKTDFYRLVNNCVYIRVPKNASNSIRAAIVQNYKDIDYQKIKFNFKDLDLSKVENIITISRNPFDRLVSCYSDRCRSANHLLTNPKFVKLSWPNFVRAVSKTPDDESDHHFRSQYWFAQPFESYENFHSFKLEEISENWNEILTLLKIENETKIPHRKKSGGFAKAWRKAQKKNKNSNFVTIPNIKYQRYDDELKELVINRYKKDFEFFGYPIP
tara:strand:+ start:285 stop:941 length:657 start_codon:yes stop_codon:yes gene_type:complete